MIFALSVISNSFIPTEVPLSVIPSAVEGPRLLPFFVSFYSEARYPGSFLAPSAEATPPARLRVLISREADRLAVGR